MWVIMKVWVLLLTLGKYNIEHKYLFLYKKNCETVGKTFLNKRKTNKYRCYQKKVKVNEQKKHR